MVAAFLPWPLLSLPGPLASLLFPRGLSAFGRSRLFIFIFWVSSAHELNDTASVHSGWVGTVVLLLYVIAPRMVQALIDDASFEILHVDLAKTDPQGDALDATIVTRLGAMNVTARFVEAEAVPGACTPQEIYRAAMLDGAPAHSARSRAAHAPAPHSACAAPAAASAAPAPTGPASAASASAIAPWRRRRRSRRSRR